MEKCNNLVSVCKTFKNLLLQNYSTKFLDIAHKKFLGMCNESLFKWWLHPHHCRNNSQIQLEHGRSNKHVKIFFTKTSQQNSLILHTNSPWVCVIEVCLNGGATFIIGELTAKDSLNITN